MKKQDKQQELTNVDFHTGEIIEPKLNEMIKIITRRPDGSLRVRLDFSNCPTMAEQHTGHLTDINYLMQKYKPDELAAYIAARAQYRQMIEGHDFSAEPNLQEANNILYKSKQAFLDLPEDVQMQFRNHLEFLKFIDNPQNAEKMLKLGILTKRQIQDVKIPDTNAIPNASKEDAGSKDDTANA